MAILAIGILGLLPLLIENVKQNEEVQRRIAAQKILEDIASELRSIKVYDFDPTNLSKIGFNSTLPSGYPVPPSDCPSGYDYTLYRGYEINKEVDGRQVKYKYTLKLCVDDDYLKPYLKRAYLYIYWLYGGKLHKSETEMFITGT